MTFLWNNPEFYRGYTQIYPLSLRQFQKNLFNVFRQLFNSKTGIARYGSYFLNGKKKQLRHLQYSCRALFRREKRDLQYAKATSKSALTSVPFLQGEAETERANKSVTLVAYFAKFAQELAFVSVKLRRKTMKIAIQNSTMMYMRNSTL